MSKELMSLFSEAQLTLHNLPTQFRILSKNYGRFNKIWDINEFIAFLPKHLNQFNLAMDIDRQQLMPIESCKKDFDVCKQQNDTAGMLEISNKLLQNVKFEIEELEKLIYQCEIYDGESWNKQDKDLFLRNLARNEIAFRLNVSMVYFLLKTLLECSKAAIIMTTTFQLEGKSTSEIEPKMIESLEALKSIISRFEKCLLKYELDRDRLKIIISGQDKEDEFQSPASMSPKPTNTVSFNFILKAGAILSGLIATSSFALVILAVQSATILTPIGLGAAVGVGVVGSLTSFGLYKLSQNHSAEQLNSFSVGDDLGMSKCQY